jgi:hypothetical protein
MLATSTPKITRAAGPGRRSDHFEAHGPIFCSLQASFTPSILPITFWKTRPSFMTASDRYSFITMSRVTGSIMIGPRGLLNFQPFSASSALSVSTLPLRVWTTWTMAAMPSYPPTAMKSGVEPAPYSFFQASTKRLFSGLSRSAWYGAW